MILYTLFEVFVFPYYMPEGFREWFILSMLAGLPGLFWLIESYVSDMSSLKEDSGKSESNDGSKSLFLLQLPIFPLFNDSDRINGCEIKPANKKIAKLEKDGIFCNPSKYPIFLVINTRKHKAAVVDIFSKIPRVNLEPPLNLYENLYSFSAWLSVYWSLRNAHESASATIQGTIDHEKSKPNSGINNTTQPEIPNIDSVTSLSVLFKAQYSLIRDLFFFIFKPQWSQYANTFITNYSA